MEINPIVNINNLLLNLHDSVPPKIATWADAKEFESVLIDHLQAVRKEIKGAEEASAVTIEVFDWEAEILTGLGEIDGGGE